MNFSFHPEALREYRESTQYYAEISPVLARAFVSRIEKGINRILLRPLASPVVDEDVRRYLVRQFPFGIYYTIEVGNTIFIHAVMHLSRKPGYWKDRLVED